MQDRAGSDRDKILHKPTLSLRYGYLRASESSGSESESVVHPSGDPTSAKARGEAQTLGAHGKVRHEVPEQGNDLDDRGDECEEQALELKEGQRGR